MEQIVKASDFQGEVVALCRCPPGANEGAAGGLTALSVETWTGIKHEVRGRERNVNSQGPDCWGLCGLEQQGYGRMCFLWPP